MTRRYITVQTVMQVIELLTIIVFHLPLWVIKAIPRRSRPRPNWTLLRTVVLQYIKHGESSSRPTGSDSPDHTVIVSGPGIKGIWVPPAPHLIRGEVKEWATLAGIDCMRIPGYWYDKPGHDIPSGATPVDEEKVIYHLHGGAFARFSANPRDTSAHCPRGILEQSRSIHRLFNLEYRRTQGPADAPTHPFPTALLDAIAGYHYLVSHVGFAPENIVLSGDSAGANLALALARYLVEQRAHGDSPASVPPAPGALVLLSPWVDLSVRGHEPNSSLYTNLESDFVDTFDPRWTLLIRQYLGPLGWMAAETNRYISPASELLRDDEVSFEGFPRTIIIVGGAETLRDQARVLQRRMVKDLGERNVEYHEFPDAFHNFMAIPGFEPERTQGHNLIHRWLETTRV